MRNFIQSDFNADSHWVEFDSDHGAVPTLEQHDLRSARQAIYDDLAEVPPAFAAYLNSQHDQRS